jgi:hypothetical protein
MINLRVSIVRTTSFSSSAVESLTLAQSRSQGLRLGQWFMSLLLLGWMALAAAADALDAQAILAAADQSRGAGLPGIEMQVHVRSEDSTGQQDLDSEVTMNVKAYDDSTFAEVVEPLRSKGMRLLLSQRNMWLHKPGMKKPVAVSVRQRLSGQAALGDIASTGYARDYTATYLRADELAGERCHVLELRSAQRNTTYDRITYWVSERSGLGIRAEFQSLSGKVLKRADFQYKLKLSYKGGKDLPFVSRMLISDVLTSEQTALEYSNVRVRAILPIEFDVGALR